MAKSKRKIYQTQRNKFAIDIAKKLKKEGILSKQVKLHGDKYISKEVLRKVKEFQHVARLNYTAVKVDKATAKAAKARGYTIVQGSRIIGPKTPTFRNRLKSGKITGVKPVKGGFMEEVTLPHTIFDIRSLVEELGEDGLDSLKLPNEQFAFKYKGGESFRAFLDSKSLLDYLLHYKGISGALASAKPEDLQEEFDALTFFRLHPSDITHSLPNPQQRMKNAAARRREAILRGEYVARRKSRKTWAEKLANMPEWRAEKLREAKRNATKAFRERLTPEQKEAIRVKRRKGK